MSLNENIFYLSLLSGLTGGLGHCIGMCGPIITAFSMTGSGGRFISQLLYHTGRIFTYTFLGALMGGGGSLVVFASHIGRFQEYLMTIAGALIVLSGLAITGVLPVRKALTNMRWGSVFISRVSSYLMEERGSGVYLPLGILLGFLPCGLVYTIMLTSMRIGMEAQSAIEGVLTGGVVMLLFGLGTSFPLIVYGRIISVIGERIRRMLYRLSGVVVVIMGIIFIVRAMGMRM